MMPNARSFRLNRQSLFLLRTFVTLAEREGLHTLLQTWHSDGHNCEGAHPLHIGQPHEGSQSDRLMVKVPDGPFSHRVRSATHDGSLTIPSVVRFSWPQSAYSAGCRMTVRTSVSIIRKAARRDEAILLFG